jgi:hypothetical protein
LERIVLPSQLDGATWLFKPPEDDEYDDRLARALLASKSLPEKSPSPAELAQRFRGHSRIPVVRELHVQQLTALPSAPGLGASDAR